MKTLHALILSLLLSVPLYGSITINFGAAVLADSGGTAMSPGGLVIVGASTLDGSFAAPTPGAFFSGDDFEVYRGVVTEGGGFAGNPLLYLGGNNWNTGDALRLYWFPTLGIGATAPGSGASYGAFRTDAVENGSDIGWLTPTDGGTYGLNFLTVSAGGIYSDTMGYANLTVVPEPATTGMIAAMVCLAGVVVSKRVRRK